MDKKQNKKLKNMIFLGIFILLIMATGFVVYENYFSNGSFLENLWALSTTEKVPEVYSVSFDQIMRDDVINDERFLILEPNGGVPITIGPIGKSNPFLYTQSD